MVKQDRGTDDNQLLRRIQAGDATAQVLFFRRYYKLVVSEGRRWGLPRLDAEEVASEVFLAMFEAARAGKLTGHMAPWLVRVTRNRAIDWQRHAKTIRERDTQIAAELAAGASDPEAGEIRLVSHEQLAVRQALQRIELQGETQRRHPKDWSYSDILRWIAHGADNNDLSQYMDTSENTARQRRFRALKMLRKELDVLLKRREDPQK